MNATETSIINGVCLLPESFEILRDGKKMKMPD